VCWILDAPEHGVCLLYQHLAFVLPAGNVGIPRSGHFLGPEGVGPLPATTGYTQLDDSHWQLPSGASVPEAAITAWAQLLLSLAAARYDGQVAHRDDDAQHVRAAQDRSSRRPNPTS
jgi:hypothetical protein